MARNERKGNERKWKEMITASSKETLGALDVLSLLRPRDGIELLNT